MNSLERILAVLNHETPDRLPVLPQIFGCSAILNDIPLDKYIQNGNLLARAQIKTQEKFGYDAVFSLIDTSLEAESLGMSLTYQPGQYPIITDRKSVV